MATAFFDRFLLAALACIGALGIGRLLVLRARGLRVLVVDRGRSPLEIAFNSALLACLLLWVWEVVTFTWPLPFLAPPILDAVVLRSVAWKAAGALFAAAAVIIYALGLFALSTSWRLGIDREAPGPLITRGIFRRTRNPIYVAFDLCLLASFLVIGRPAIFVLAGLLAALLHEQILQEERFLAQRHGEAFREYAARVGRYWSVRPSR